MVVVTRTSCGGGDGGGAQCHVSGKNSILPRALVVEVELPLHILAGLVVPSSVRHEITVFKYKQITTLWKHINSRLKWKILTNKRRTRYSREL